MGGTVTLAENTGAGAEFVITLQIANSGAVRHASSQARRFLSTTAVMIMMKARRRSV